MVLVLQASVHRRRSHECDIVVLKVHGLTPSEISTSYIEGWPFFFLEHSPDLDHQSDAVGSFRLDVECTSWCNWERRGQFLGEDELCLVLPNEEEPGLNFEIKQVSEKQRIEQLRDIYIGPAEFTMSVQWTENILFHVLQLCLGGMDARTAQISYTSESGIVEVSCSQPGVLVQELWIALKCPWGASLQSKFIPWDSHLEQNCCTLSLFKTDHKESTTLTVGEAEAVCSLILDRLLQLVKEEAETVDFHENRFHLIKEQIVFWAEKLESYNLPCLYASSLKHVEVIKDLWGRSIQVKAASTVNNKREITKRIIFFNFLKTPTADEDDDVSDGGGDDAGDEDPSWGW